MIEAFNGKILPDYIAFGNRLVHDYSIETAAKDIASKNFIRSAEYSGVMPSKNSGEQFIFEFAGGIKLVIPRNEKTSEAIIDGELKETRKTLLDFAEKFVVEEVNNNENNK